MDQLGKTSNLFQIKLRLELLMSLKSFQSLQSLMSLKTLKIKFIEINLKILSQVTVNSHHGQFFKGFFLHGDPKTGA